VTNDTNLSFGSWACQNKDERNAGKPGATQKRLEEKASGLRAAVVVDCDNRGTSRGIKVQSGGTKLVVTAERYAGALCNGSRAS
jgi:hypothetical protein